QIRCQEPILRTMMRESPFRFLTFFSAPRSSETGFEKLKQGRTEASGQVRCFFFSVAIGTPVRTLNERDEQGCIRKRTPAMAAELADHVWTMREWITYPSIQRC